ncbi:RNA polymerase sigma factor [Roseiconus nitratireducens]|uniref:RNA polymerase sigma factor n=1 Tax=Roseiconus nitratireducens TaxID=2605748 RepID=UPI001F310B17|nr:sigma-70 family RNA polymerase sigma factor [Roseiconus nitratireducens]
MNNADFIDGLRNQDPAAAKHLNECFVPSVWRFVFFRVDRNAHLAEDIVAETVLQLISAAASEVAIENPGAWLRTVAARRVQDHYRAAARVQHLIEQAAQQAERTDDQDPARMHDTKLKRQCVREAMDGLPDTYRMALEWKYIEQLTVQVIAQRLDTSHKGAESILFRARNALRKRLQSEAPSPPGPQAAGSPNSQSSTDVASNPSGAPSNAPGNTPGPPGNIPDPPGKIPDQQEPSADDPRRTSMQERPTLFLSPRFARES